MAKETTEICRVSVVLDNVAIKEQEYENSVTGEKFLSTVYNATISDVEDKKFSSIIGEKLPIGISTGKTEGSTVKAYLVEGEDNDGNPALFLNEMILEKTLTLDKIRDILKK